MNGPHMQATQSISVCRHQGTRQQAAQDRVICEHPVAIVFNGLSHAVMMATPVDLADFGLGFALSEGLIEQVRDCHDIAVHDSPHGIEIHMQISARQFEALKDKRRTLAGRTGCGLCGADSLQALQQSHPAALPPRQHGITPATISKAFAQLAEQQALQADTGACHAAAWASVDGCVLITREDVGRHNALDKLIGHLARAGQLKQEGFVLMSSRASYELISKCARVGIGTLATISAPTSMAVDMAKAKGLHLFGFCRGDSAVEYTRPDQALIQTSRTTLLASGA